MITLSENLLQIINYCLCQNVFACLLKVIFMNCVNEISVRMSVLQLSVIYIWYEQDQLQKENFFHFICNLRICIGWYGYPFKRILNTERLLVLWSAAESKWKMAADMNICNSMVYPVEGNDSAHLHKNTSQYVVENELNRNKNECIFYQCTNLNCPNIIPSVFNANLDDHRRKWGTWDEFLYQYLLSFKVGLAAFL